MRKISDNKKRKTNILLIIIIVVAAVVLAICVYFLFDYYNGANEEQLVYAELDQYAIETVDVSGEIVIDSSKETEVFQTGFYGDEIYYYDPEVNDLYYILANRDIDVLHSDYEDVAAWIYIPGTKISYPVMSSEGEEYLYKNYKKESVRSGALFFFNTQSFDPQDDNIVIHGHNMKSGMMFGSLKAFWLVPEMWTGHNILYVDLPGHVKQTYQIFSIYIENTTANTIPTSFADGNEKIEYFNNCQKKSKYSSDIDFDENDKIITLSTCTHLENAGTNDRLIVQAKLLN